MWNYGSESILTESPSWVMHYTGNIIFNTKIANPISCISIEITFRTWLNMLPPKKINVYECHLIQHVSESKQSQISHIMVTKSSRSVADCMW